MTRTFSSTHWLIISLCFFLVFALLRFELPFGAIQAPNRLERSGEMEIEMEGLAALFPSISSFSRLSSDSGTKLSPEGFNLKNPPPEICSRLPGGCRWIVTTCEIEGGRRSYHIFLVSGNGQIVARANAIVVEFQKYPGFSQALEACGEAGKQIASRGYGWDVTIEVAKSLQGSGLGKIMWQNMDSILAVQDPGSFNIFVDVCGWAQSLLEGVKNILVSLFGEGGSVYIYSY